MVDQTTALVIGVVTVLLLAYDLWTYVKRGNATTLSWTMYVWAFKWPILCVAWGVLTGHFFWAQGCQP